MAKNKQSNLAALGMMTKRESDYVLRLAALIDSGRKISASQLMEASQLYGRTNARVPRKLLLNTDWSDMPELISSGILDDDIEYAKAAEAAATYVELCEVVYKYEALPILTAEAEQ